MNLSSNYSDGQKSEMGLTVQRLRCQQGGDFFCMLWGKSLP